MVVKMRWWVVVDEDESDEYSDDADDEYGYDEYPYE